jgi:hypothetical protein
MAVSNTAVFPQAPMKGLVQIVNADSTGKKTACTAGANGSKVTGLNVCSDDTSNRTLQVFITRSATDYLIGTAVITTLAGTDGSTLPIDVLSLIPGLPVDNDGQRYLFLQSGDTLRVAITSAVTAAKTVHVATEAADF